MVDIKQSRVDINQNQPNSSLNISVYFTSNDLGQLQTTNLTHTICDLQHHIIQFNDFFTRRCHHIQHGIQISKQLEC